MPSCVLLKFTLRDKIWIYMYRFLRIEFQSQRFYVSRAWWVNSNTWYELLHTLLQVETCDQEHREQISTIVKWYVKHTQPFIQTQIKENIKALCRWPLCVSPVNSPHKWPVTRKMFPFDDVIMCCSNDNCHSQYCCANFCLNIFNDEYSRSNEPGMC